MMWKISGFITEQYYAFCISILVGAFLLLFYDAFRVFRRVISHGKLWVALEDVFFCIVAGIMMFVLFTQVESGDIRFFLFCGVFLGGISAHILFSKIFLKSAKYIKKLCRYIIRKIIPFFKFIKNQCAKVWKMLCIGFGKM